MRSRTTALLPVALLAVLVFWCGTFQGAASASGAIAYQAAILLFCLLTPGLWDPLDLGRSGRLLPLAVLAVAAISWGLSSVGRAGVVGLALLPAFVCLPSATARCWRDSKSQRLALIALSLLTLSVCLTALFRWQTLSLPRVSLPLGHHNLMAGWLVLVLPLVLATSRFPGGSRWLACMAGAVGLLTLAATGSLLGVAATAAQLILAAVWWRRPRAWVVPGLLTLAVLTLPRLLAISQSVDLSTLARVSYLEAGWRGLLKKPGLGWGPGAVPWTVGGFMRPSVGVHPASHIVGDLHSLPMQLAYEIGIAGTLLTIAVAMVFLLRRTRETDCGEDDVPRRAALLGLLGGIVFSLGAAPLAVPAIPATAAVVAGAALQSSATEPAWRRAPILGAYLLLAAGVLLPLNRAHLSYDQARISATPAAGLEHIDRAQELDPGFPLYLARRAWLASEIQGVDDGLANQALQAARMAPGLAPLWLAAGDLGRRAGQPWAPAAVSRARDLDPLSPLVLFHLMTLSPSSSEETARLAEAALAAEPRLAAAQWWWEHPGLATRVSRHLGQPIPQRIESSQKGMVLALTLDRDPALSFSLFAFRRSPWPGRLAPVELLGDESTSPNTTHP